MDRIWPSVFFPHQWAINTLARRSLYILLFVLCALLTILVINESTCRFCSRSSSISRRWLTPMMTCWISSTWQIKIEKHLGLNKPFPSCFMPRDESEAWCTTFHMKTRFHLHANKTHCHMKGCAPSLAFITRHKATRKWLDSLAG